MKPLLFLLTFLFNTLCFSQNLEKIAKEIQDEGITLYRSEMASWYGTDIFLENYKDRENIGGYFSYIDDGVPKCVFYSKAEKIIGTIAFPTNYLPANAKLDLTDRAFTPTEQEYLDLRKAAFARMENDTIFKYYENVNFNVVPMINGKERKVYLLSGPKVNNIVLFGNDYLLQFNKQNKITSVEQLHKSLIVQKIVDEEVGKTVSAIHSHVVKNWPYMTPTDICTLMLYQHLTDWETYTVVNKDFTSIWNCKTNHLTIMKTDVLKKIFDDRKKDGELAKTKTE